MTAIAAAASHSCALRGDGTVKCWGDNDSGELGLGDTTVRGDGPNEMGDNLSPVNLGAGRTATAITAGENHTCARLDNGTVKCWGNNDSGQLGLGDTVDRGDGPNEMGDNLPTVNLGAGRTATAITAGAGHTCALLDNSTVKCWGSGGLLGLGDTADRGDGPNEMGDNLPTVNLGAGPTATAISAGRFHTCARLGAGTVKCWGLNLAGRLGLGDTATRGDGPGEMGDNLPAVNLGAGRTATAITTGRFSTCSRLDNGAVKCWGGNYQGELGLGDTADRGDGPNEMGDNLPTVNLGTGRTATAITAGGGNGHMCAVLDNGTVKCWGFNGFGELGLGLGDYDNRGDGPGEMGNNLPAVDFGAGRTATAISAGNGHTCAVLDNATVKCWGWNGFGQLGLGDTGDRGGGPGEMGDNLPAVALGDTLAPTVDLRTPPASAIYTRNQAVIADFSCADETGGSGLASCVGTVADGATVDTTTLGAKTFIVTATDNAGNTTQTTRTYTVVADPRPDGRIKRGATGAYKGDNVYNTTGVGQTQNGTGAVGSTVTYYVAVQNDAPFADTLRLRATVGTTRYAVTYFNGTENITSAVTQGAYVTPVLAPGAEVVVKVKVKVRTAAPVGSSLIGTLSVKSETDPTQRDVVRFRTSRG